MEDRKFLCVNVDDLCAHLDWQINKINADMESMSEKGAAAQLVLLQLQAKLDLISDITMQVLDESDTGLAFDVYSRFVEKDVLIELSESAVVREEEDEEDGSFL